MRIIYNTYTLAKSASCRASCAKSISSLYGLLDVVMLGIVGNGYASSKRAMGPFQGSKGQESLLEAQIYHYLLGDFELLGRF